MHAMRCDATFPECSRGRSTNVHSERSLTTLHERSVNVPKRTDVNRTKLQRSLLAGYVLTLYPVYTMKLARRAGSSSARRAGSRALVERSTSSFVNVCNIKPFKWPDSQLIKPARRALFERSTSQFVEPASSCKRGISDTVAYCDDHD